LDGKVKGLGHGRPKQALKVIKRQRCPLDSLFLISTNANDFMERLVSKTTNHVSSIGVRRYPAQPFVLELSGTRELVALKKVDK